jgi:hypothetical protein
VFEVTAGATETDKELETTLLLERLVLLCEVVMSAEEELDVTLVDAIRREGSDLVTVDEEDDGVDEEEGVELVEGVGVWVVTGATVVVTGAACTEEVTMT